MKDYLNDRLQHLRTYAAAMAKWLVLAGVTGVCCGLVGTAFHLAVEHAIALRAAYPWLLYALPLAGLGIVAMYKLTGIEGQGTNNVIETVQNGRPLSPWLLPAIFASTVLTHLFGGSAGREGAALQMGGDIGYHVGRLLHFSNHDRRTATMCGMAAFFSALFGTPLAATLFAIMVINVGMAFYSAFIPCFAASLVAYGISLGLGVAPTRFAVAAPPLTTGMTLRVAVLAVGCALVTVLFCGALHTAEHQLAKRLPNAWVRVVAGGCGVVLLTLLIGSQRYNGTGIGVIAQAVEQGQAQPWDWLLKIVFTALTLAAGYKGGEVVPSFFIGATFGCVAGPLLGIPAGFAAAVGLVAVFCGATNCLIATLFLAVELFGADGMLYYAVACGLSYVLSGYSGLYSSQAIFTSKLASEYYETARRPQRPENAPETDAEREFAGKF